MFGRVAFADAGRVSSVLIAAGLLIALAAPAVPAAAATAGSVYAWGYDGYGELGNGADGPSVWTDTPATVQGVTGAVAVAGASGGETGYALLANGTVEAWGQGSQGQLGNGEIVPTSDSAVSVTGLSDVVAIAGGLSDGYALLRNGTVWAWGNNFSGELGTGSTAAGNSDVPGQVSGLSGVVAIAANWETAYALLSDGTVWAWGNNVYGTLGNGTSGGYSDVPVEVSGLSSVVALSTSGGGQGQDGYALLSDGTVWAWGYNGSGQLGNGTTGNGTTSADSSTPVQVSGLSGITAIAGPYALSADGTVWAWGYDADGELGDGSATYAASDLPVQVAGLANVGSIAAGSLNGYALLQDGTVWAWGDNSYGQLGANSGAPNSSTPVEVAGLADVTALGSATATAFAVTGTAQAPAIVTSSATSRAFLGEPISDQAYLGDATATAGGTITFTAFSDSGCTDLVYQSPPISVSGNGAYPASGRVQFVPTTTGTYYWVAAYSGDANNPPVTEPCDAAGEASVVLPPRYVALGDSVPYGHGLVNPYPQPQLGLSASAVQQGPSAAAYPALVAATLHLTMNIRSANCTLTGDDLAISGAAAAQADARPGNDQCAAWTDSESVSQDELPAAQLAASPAELVTIQAGADDIDFSACMAWELTKFGAFHLQGTQCVKDGQVTPAIAAELANVTAAIASEIEQAAPYAQHIAVLNYYQAIPSPADFQKATIFPGGEVNPVCWGLSHNLSGAYTDAVIIQAGLNGAIAAGVNDAIASGVDNVQLVNVAGLETGHEICTGDPALFSGEPMPKAQFYNDLATIGACSIYYSPHCQSAEPRDVTDLSDHIWRAAHPNAYGQQDIARAVEGALGK